MGKIKNKHNQSIWFDNATAKVFAIDQRKLPFHYAVLELAHTTDFITAIRDMVVRGAPLIGLTAAYGMYMAAREARQQPQPMAHVENVAKELKETRPTAVDLFKAVDNQLTVIHRSEGTEQAVQNSLATAQKLEKEIISICYHIGLHGLPLIEEISRRKNGEAVNILTHCNAGWLATVAHGTATAPIYLAHEKKIPLHVWVDETRPRNQGSFLTAWELGQQGVPHSIIVDNAGGHLMQNEMVDMVIVGTDRTTRNGDVANKIGTYLKALAAKDNNIPFYVAAPSTSIDFSIVDGCRNIKIEERPGDEVRYIRGMKGHSIEQILVTPGDSPVKNFAFDVTPAKLVTALLTERGICKADEKNILKLFPEYERS